MMAAADEAPAAHKQQPLGLRRREARPNVTADVVTKMKNGNVGDPRRQTVATIRRTQADQKFPNRAPVGGTQATMQSRRCAGQKCRAMDNTT